MVYYGDEAGMWGGDDPDCRKPMVWENMNYEVESVDPLGRPRPADTVRFNKYLFDWYKKLIFIRNNNKALSLGDLNFFLIDNPNKILGYSRTFNGKTLYIIINNKSGNAHLTIDLSKYSKTTGSLNELVSGKDIKISGKKYKLQLPGYGVTILE